MSMSLVENYHHEKRDKNVLNISVVLREENTLCVRDDLGNRTGFPWEGRANKRFDLGLGPTGIPGIGEQVRSVLLLPQYQIAKAMSGNFYFPKICVAIRKNCRLRCRKRKPLYKRHDLTWWISPWFPPCAYLFRSYIELYNFDAA